MENLEDTSVSTNGTGTCYSTIAAVVGGFPYSTFTLLYYTGALQRVQYRHIGWKALIANGRVVLYSTVLLLYGTLPEYSIKKV